METLLNICLVTLVVSTTVLVLGSVGAFLYLVYSMIVEDFS